MSQTIQFLSQESLAFPSVEQALLDPNGLLAIGGDLTPKRLVSAYQQGIFPWYSKQDPLMWWSPNPRAIIPVNEIRINKSLQKFINKSPYKISINKNFRQVITACANAPFRKEGTWILPEMLAAYIELHKQGFAHSIEVWLEEELVGGLYGVAINGYFSGESMFYTQTNASKIALVKLSQLLVELKVDFIDCQLQNPFLQSMGCIEISRLKFIELKNLAINRVIPENFWSNGF